MLRIPVAVPTKVKMDSYDIGHRLPDSKKIGFPIDSDNVKLEIVGPK